MRCGEPRLSVLPRYVLFVVEVLHARVDVVLFHDLQVLLKGDLLGMVVVVLATAQLVLIVGAIAVLKGHFAHHVGGRRLEVVSPAQLGEDVDPDGGNVEEVAELGRLVVPGEHMVVVVPALTHSNQ